HDSREGALCRKLDDRHGGAEGHRGIGDREKGVSLASDPHDAGALVVRPGRGGAPPRARPRGPPARHGGRGQPRPPPAPGGVGAGVSSESGRTTGFGSGVRATTGGSNDRESEMIVEPLTMWRVTTIRLDNA